MALINKLFGWIRQQLMRIARLRPHLESVVGDTDITQLVKGSGIALIFKVISLPLGLLSSLIISRRYGADAMGIYGLTTTILSIVISLGLWGLGTAMPRFLGEIKATEPDTKKQNGHIRTLYRTSLWTVIAVSFILSFVLYFLAKPLAVNLFSDTRLVLPLQIASLFVIPLVRYTLNTQFLLAHKRVYQSEVVTKGVVPIVFVLGLVGAWLWGGDDIVLPVWAYITSMLAGLGVSLWILWRDKTVALRGKLANWRQMVKVSSPMWMTGIVGIISEKTDVLMIGYFMDSSYVGIYNVAYLLMALGMLFVTQTLSFVIRPLLSQKFWENDLQGINKLLRTFSRISFIVSLGFYLIILIWGNSLLGWRGREFVVGYDFLVILGLGWLINNANGYNGGMLSLIGKEKEETILLVFVFVANVILNFIMYSFFGFLGFAIATTITIVLHNIYLSMYLYKKYNIKTFIH